MRSQTSVALPRPTRLYYGWINLALASLAMVATLPGRTQGLGLITEPLITGLRLDRITFASINLWATLIGAACCLPCGKLADRYGSRVVLTGLAALLGASVLLLSRSEGIVMPAIAITLTRGLGQSALSVASLALAGKWFARRLNTAMGIYALLVGMGFVSAFPAVGHLVLSSGWRPAWAVVGAAILAAAPLFWFAVRDDLEREDGDVEGIRDQPSDLTLRQALRSAAFWIFALSSSIFGLVYSGIALFNQSILEQHGFDATVYHRVLVISTMLGLTANFGGGRLAQRYPIQRVMGIGMGALAIALGMLPSVRTAAQVDIYAGIMGIAGGVVTVVFFSAWSEFFGRTHLGRIQGCAQTLTVLASAAGPLLLAATLESTGSYDIVFQILAGLVLCLGIASWRVQLPRRAFDQP